MKVVTEFVFLRHRAITLGLATVIAVVGLRGSGVPAAEAATAVRGSMGSEVVFEHEQELRGTIAARVIRVPAGVVVRVAEDTVLRATELLVVDGELIAADVALLDTRTDAPNITLESAGRLTVRGLVRGGRGKCYAAVDPEDAALKAGGRGSAITLQAPDLYNLGVIEAGSGGHGGGGAAGGEGGGLWIIGETCTTHGATEEELAAQLGRVGFRTGSGGDGGVGLAAHPAGGSGGAGGGAVWQPHPLPVSDEPPSVSQPICPTHGKSGAPQPDLVGQDGGDGADGFDGTETGPNGGPGGNGGAGASVVGHAGSRGTRGLDCCPTGSNGAGGNGGNGGPGGKATGGRGGDGGDGGDAWSSSSGQSGTGGNAGPGGNAQGGRGGNGVPGAKGTPPGAGGAGGGGGPGIGGTAGSPGAKGSNGGGQPGAAGVNGVSNVGPTGDGGDAGSYCN